MPPKIFGILNITTDSFSDGGQFLDPQAAMHHAAALLQDGADVLDIGAASSHPDSCEVAPEVEMKRLESVVPHLQKKGAAISIDSCQPETQLWALAQKVDWLNDVQGFGVPEIYPALAKSTARLCVMHQCTPANATPDDIWPRIEAFFDQRLDALQKAGIDKHRLVLDPGMGLFLSRTPKTSFCVLAALGRLKEKYNLPVLICVSRKSFLREQNGAGNMASVTLAAEIFAAAQGVDFIRTHDVDPLKNTLNMLEK